jgi:hypothetical protein
VPGCGALNLQPPDALPDDPSSAYRRLCAVNLIDKNDAELNYRLLIKVVTKQLIPLPELHWPTT